MWKFTIPGTDLGIKAKGQQFQTGFNIYAVDLGLSVGDTDAVNAAVTSYVTNLTAVEVARDAYRSAVAEKDAAQAELIDVLREYAQAVKTNPLATPDMFASMGIVPASAPVGPVTQPTSLSADPNSNGTCVLKWNRNGNNTRTTYVIETSTDGGPWTWLTNTTRTRFTDPSAQPGVPRLYRVRAQRSGETSPPSSEAGIYTGGNSLQIAA
jgi:hypothetical protein